MRKIADRRGGSCLSANFVDMKTRLVWMCSIGHVWEATGDNILNRKTWCPFCCGRKGRTIEDMRQLALLYEGECLSDIYINAKIKLKWKCKFGHIFEAQPNCVQQGRWCGKCSRLKIITKRD